MTEPQHSQHEQYKLEQDRWALALRSLVTIFGDNYDQD